MPLTMSRKGWMEREGYFSFVSRRARSRESTTWAMNKSRRYGGWGVGDGWIQGVREGGKEGGREGGQTG